MPQMHGVDLSQMHYRRVSGDGRRVSREIYRLLEVEGVCAGEAVLDGVLWGGEVGGGGEEGYTGGGVCVCVCV